MSGTSDKIPYNDPGVPKPSCATLQIDTQLSSPKEDVIENIAVGDILDIDLLSEGGQTVVVAVFQGKVAGGIASPKIQQLRECLESGFKYQGEVISKKEGQVRVQIRPSSV